jgi:hypothetical protein
MRHLRRIVLATVAVALCAPSVAGAHSTSKLGGGVLVPPYAKVDGLTGGDAMGEMWYRGYTLPAAENQGFGNGKPCVRLGRTGNILVGAEFQPGPCSVNQGTTVLIWGITSTCDNFDPLNGYYGADEAAQRECAVTTLAPYVEAIRLTVDNGEPVDFHSRRFAIFSPQRKVLVRADNPFGLPAGRGTFTAWGWVAWLKDLSPGRHMIRSEAAFNDGSDPHESSLVINVIQRRSGAGG